MAVLDYAGLRRYDGKIKQYTGDLVDTVIEVTDTQPVDLYNKIWIETSEEDVELAEMSDVDELKSAITYATGNEAIAIAVKDKYLKIINNVIDINNPQTSSTGYGYVIVPCSTGDTFIVSGVSSVNEPMAWAFTDSSYTILSKAAANVTVTNAEIVAPDNASYLVIHDKSPYRLSYKGIALQVTVNNNKNAIDSIVEETPGVNLFDGSFPQSGYLNSSGEQPSSNFKRTDYFPIYGQNDGYVYIYLSETVDTFVLLAYDENKTYISGSTTQANNVTTKTGVLSANAKYFRAYTRAAFSGNVTISLSPVTSYVPYALENHVKPNVIDFDNLTVDVQNALNHYDTPIFINGISRDVLTGFYLLDDSYTPYGISATASQFRMKLKDSNGNVRVNGLNVIPEFYSDKIQRFVDESTKEVVAYYVIHYTGTSYAIDSNSLTFTDNATSLTNNRTIAEYLGRAENLVLIGDSLFGYQTNNVLEAILSTMSNKQVFNCGFGGCRMSWATADGSGTYDPFTFVTIADEIAAGDFSTTKAAALSSLNQAYPYRCASLTSIDWTKPTTIFVNYVNNDITSDVPIGDTWDYEAESFNKQTVLGAFNYGLGKILEEYPHIHVVEFTSAWRKLGGNSVPPYAYQNTLNKTPLDYDTAIKENASRQGIAVYDYFNDGGRNWYNRSYYQVDNSHYNEKGYAMFAKILNALDRSFKD